MRGVCQTAAAVGGRPTGHPQRPRGPECRGTRSASRCRSWSASCGNTTARNTAKQWRWAGPANTPIFAYRTPLPVHRRLAGRRGRHPALVAASTVAFLKRRGWRRQFGGRRGTIATRAAGFSPTRPAPFSPNGLSYKHANIRCQIHNRTRSGMKPGPVPRLRPAGGLRCDGPAKPPAAALARHVTGGHSSLANLAAMHTHSKIRTVLSGGDTVQAIHQHQPRGGRCRGINPFSVLAPPHTVRGTPGLIRGLRSP